MRASVVTGWSPVRCCRTLAQLSRQKPPEDLGNYFHVRYVGLFSCYLCPWHFTRLMCFIVHQLSYSIQLHSKYFRLKSSKKLPSAGASRPQLRLHRLFKVEGNLTVLPITHIGFLANRSLPTKPRYFDLRGNDWSWINHIGKMNFNDI